MDQMQQTEEDKLAELAILRKEQRRLYMTVFNRENYEKKLKNNKVICTVCEKTYHTTNRWKHNNSKFHNFFKELIEVRGLKTKEETI